ncbi:MAG: IclR family transcriptional regulator [Bacillota bacterium]|nr:IclR family transcriptional regulator [Bacillota bacterium]
MSSAEKAMKILKLLSENPYEIGVTELSNKMGYAKSGIHKLLSSLSKGGLVQQRENKKYSLGIGVYLLGKSYEENVGIEKFCKPYLAKLRNITNENASFGMWISNNPVLVHREESNELVRVVGAIGGTRPIYASAIGKVLAAFQDEDIIRKKLMEEPITSFTPNTIVEPNKILEEYKKIRKQGYSVSSEEYAMETIGVGAPIKDHSGKVWAAISLGAPKMRTSKSKIDKYIYLVTQTAEMIKKDLAI